MNHLQDKFKKEVIPALMKHFDYNNIHRVPRLEKIVVNMGVGEAAHDVKQLLGLKRREHGSRLVQYQDFCLAVQGLQDLDSLPNTYR